VYFRNVGRSNGLCIFGKDLTSTQQDLALEIFQTVRFGGPVPRYVLPPPDRQTVDGLRNWGTRVFEVSTREDDE